MQVYYYITVRWNYSLKEEFNMLMMFKLMETVVSSVTIPRKYSDYVSIDIDGQ